MGGVLSVSRTSFLLAAYRNFRSEYGFYELNFHQMVKRNTGNHADENCQEKQDRLDPRLGAEIRFGESFNGGKVHAKRIMWVR